MPWIKFEHDFDWHVPAHKGAVTISYKSGMTQLVTMDCADQAIKSGTAKRIQRPGDGKRQRRTIQETD